MPPLSLPPHSRYNSCRPPLGQVYLTIGQDLFAIDDYLREQYNATLHEYIYRQQHKRPTTSLPHRSNTWPAAFMAYSDLATLKGLETPTDYGSGVEYANGLAALVTGNDNNAAPEVGLQLGLWLGGADGCRAVLNGTWTPQIRQLVQYLGYNAPFSRIFVRLGYEFDNPSFGYAQNPVAYREAWKIIVTACRHDHACRDKALFVWHSWAAGVPYNLQLEDFYPGNDYVDWIGVSVFQQVYHSTTPSGPNSIWSGGSHETLTAVLEYATAPRMDNKPIMIAESTPFGGIDNAKDHDAWNTWFRPVLNILHNYPSIAMWSYIDCNWNSLPMWHNVGFGDTRLAKNETIQRLWQQRVVKHTLGYRSLPLYCGGGVGKGSDNGNATDKSSSGKHHVVPSAMLVRSSAAPMQQHSVGTLMTSSTFIVAVLVLVLFVVIGRRRRQHQIRRHKSYQSIT